MVYFLIRGGWSGREYGITIGQSISGDVIVFDFSSYAIYVGMKMANETYQAIEFITHPLINIILNSRHSYISSYVY